jgi:hypothetical protein
VTTEQSDVVEATPVAQRARRSLRLDPRWVLVFFSYGTAARLLYLHETWLPRGQIPFSASSDQVQEVWYVGWLAHAVSHLQNPFFTTAINYPHGVNLMTNTASPLLGVLFAPLTWLAGPLATYVVLLELGFTLSALSAAVCARRLGLGWWRAWFLGAVFGFCANRIVEGTIHIFLAFDVTMPWVFYGAIRFWQGQWSPRRFGVTVGVLLAADFLISTERVGMELYALGIIVLLDLINHRTWQRLRDIVAGYAIAAAVLGVLACVPIWYFFFGPQSISGMPHNLATFKNTSLSQLIQPGPYALFAPFGGSSLGSSALQGIWNSTPFLGLPALALAVVGIVRNWRDPLTRGVTIVTLFFLMLTLGSTVEIPLIHVSVWTPERLLPNLPLAQDILPFRFIEVVVLGVAYLAALGLVGVRVRAPRPRAVLGATGAALAVLTLLSLLPGHALPAGTTSSTPWLQTAAARAVLPDTAVALTYPYPITLFNTPMLDDAESGLWYHLIGGQAITPGPNGDNVGVQPLAPSAVFAALYRASQPDPTAPVTGFPFTVAPLPPLDATTSALFQQFVTEHHVTVVFWRQWGYHPQLALEYLQNAFGPGTSYAGETVRVWTLPGS